jgi:hypothetical protein
VAEVTVDPGLPLIGYVNGLFATVTVCVPGTSDCQSIDHVLVDTGSSGLRLLGSELTIALPAWTDDSSGLPLAECTQFVDSYIWGSLRSADIKIAGEQASNLAVQVVDESTYPVPNDCTGKSADTAKDLGANGIVGVGTLVQDCGAACAASLSSGNPGLYYTCASASTGGCQAAAVPTAKQVSNPVAFFTQDNNGTIIELPAVPAAGAPSVTGSLVFGIGTRDNNVLAGAKVIRLDEYGTFLTQYPTPNGRYAMSFVDSGSNGIYFLDSSTTRIPACRGQLSSFYCPASEMNLSAKGQDVNGVVTVKVNFSIANPGILLTNSTISALDNLGGPSISPSSGDIGMYFDWGLPFYFGRNVFTAITGQSTPGGIGPFVAF